MKTRHLLFLAAALCFFPGCSQPLRTLMAVDSEQKAQRSLVSEESRRFELLLREAKKGMVKAGKSKEQIISRYGEPVVVSPGEAEPVRETFLYRKPLEFMAATKVYLDFDENGILLDARIEEPRAE